ncbi:MAG: biopolymer transporter ExbD [Alphaproteobacteria bacterium]|nr:biopolymer transporter ExbD [Alphaproteobacteria bacterium]
MRFKTTKIAKPPAENMIALINIVFLILIFFLVASVVRPFSDREVRLAQSADPKSAGVGTRMAVLRRDGSKYLGGALVSDAQLQSQFKDWAAEPKRGVTLVADRDMPASALIAIVTQANAAGLADVKLLTRKAR